MKTTAEAFYCNDFMTNKDVNCVNVELLIFAKAHLTV